MSIFSDIGNAVSGAVSSLANIAATVAPVLFPQAALAMTATNLLTQAVGGGVNQAVSQLTKEAGLPKFLMGPIADVVKNVVDQFCKPSDSQCDNHVREHCGNDFRDIGESVGRSIADIVKQLRCGGEDGGGADSWLVAIAKAMGKVAGQHAKKLADLSNKLDGLQGKDSGNADQAQQITNQMQGESQMLNLLQTAFSNVLKSIGESIANMARKG
jgi:hypothetical protein